MNKQVTNAELTGLYQALIDLSGRGGWNTKAKYAIARTLRVMRPLWKVLAEERQEIFDELGQKDGEGNFRLTEAGEGQPGGEVVFGDNKKEADARHTALMEIEIEYEAFEVSFDNLGEMDRDTGPTAGDFDLLMEVGILE